MVDFGDKELRVDDDYPDFVVPLARAVAGSDVQRGVAVCGSGVGATVAANKVHGVRAALITDTFSAHQGVEDDDMNVLCLGARVVGIAAGLGAGRNLPGRPFQRGRAAFPAAGEGPCRRAIGRVIHACKSPVLVRVKWKLGRSS